MDHYAQARRKMVDGQLRPNKVTDQRILSAMLDLPREQFLPERLRVRAYTDEDVPLGRPGRALMEPMVLGRLLQLAAVRRGDRALALPAGTGYAAAVLAAMGARVIAVEDDEELVPVARAALARFSLPEGARLVRGPVAQGHAAGAPYDAILREGEVAEVPQVLADQLAEGGRLVTVLARGGRAATAVLGRRIGGTFTVTPVFDCAVTPLPDFAPAAAAATPDAAGAPRFVF
jgi:protein-L-isoaspartate(D-aspartate) O-methyltransferase